MKKVKKIYKKIKIALEKMLPKFGGFTLVELIIGMTIITILATIAFVSVFGFLKYARDVSRLENLTRIDSVIELFDLQNGYYPEPEEAVDITFSGAVLWSQGKFGSNTLLTVRGLHEKPTDLVSENDFAYSLANNKREYELGAVIESDMVVQHSIIPKAYAKNNHIPVRSMVVGNYNGLSLNVHTGSLLYILALPTILSYDTVETDIIELIEKKTLAYKGYGNIASAYTGTVFKIDGGFDFDPSILVVYSGAYDNFMNNESEWINTLNNFQLAYSGSNVNGSTILDSILGSDIEPLNPSKEVRELAYHLVENELNIELPIVLTSGPNWLTYDTSNSLLDNDTRSILQDTALDMWFATKNGVSTFAGNTWGSYAEADGLVDKDVRVVLQADSGDMWFATNKGVSIFDGTTWSEYTESDGLIDDDVVDMIQSSSGDFWFATKKGVSRFDGTIWTDYTKSNGIANKIVTGVAEQLGGNIWISTINGVSEFNGTTWITYGESDGLVDKNVLDVYTDSTGNMWFATVNGVSTFNGTTWITYNEFNGLIDKYVNNIFEDSNGNMWFATVAGASMFDGSTWVDYTIADGLADNDVQVIYQDADENIWFGTKKGITIYFN